MYTMCGSGQLAPQNRSNSGVYNENISGANAAKEDEHNNKSKWFVLCVCVFLAAAAASPTQFKSLAKIFNTIRVRREPPNRTQRRWQRRRRRRTSTGDRQFLSGFFSFIACMHNGLADYCSNSHETLMNFSYGWLCICWCAVAYTSVLRRVATQPDRRYWIIPVCALYRVHSRFGSVAWVASIHLKHRIPAVYDGGTPLEMIIFGLRFNHIIIFYRLFVRRSLGDLVLLWDWYGICTDY